MKLEALVTCAACVLLSGCSSGSIDPAGGGAAPHAKTDAAHGDDTSTFAPATDPPSDSPDEGDDASIVDTGSDPADPPLEDSGAAPDTKSSGGWDGGSKKDSGSHVADSSVTDSGKWKGDTSVADSHVIDTSVVDTSVLDTGTAAEDTGSVVADTGTMSKPDSSPVDTGSSLMTDAGTSLVWRTANLTTFTSYPDPGSEECIKYSGCTWAGQFAALPSKMPESWVAANNIIAVHSKDFPTYKLHTLRLRQGTHQIDAIVYDMCADSDCSGCCTANSKSTGFLIDIESYTGARFGTTDGIVEWTCLDC